MEQTTSARGSRRRLIAPAALIGIAILGALAIAIVPRLTARAEAARKDACAQNVATINTEAERWYFEKGTWPAMDLSDLARDPGRLPTGTRFCPVDGSAYVLDPTTHRVKGHTH